MNRRILFLVYSFAALTGTITVLAKIWEIDLFSGMLHMLTTGLLLGCGLIVKNSDLKLFSYCVLGAICLTFTSDYFELFTQKFELSVWICVGALIALILAQHFLWGFQKLWGILIACLLLGFAILLSIKYYINDLDSSIYVFSFFNAILLWQSIANMINTNSRGTKWFFFAVLMLTIHSIVTSILQYIAEYKVLNLILMYAYWFSHGIFIFLISRDRSFHLED